MTSIELAKLMRKNNPELGASGRNKSAVKPYNGVSSLYDGEGRGGVGSYAPKKVGCVTKLASNRF